jgi:DNA-binding CsgD family transcriptional regulator
VTVLRDNHQWEAAGPALSAALRDDVERVLVQLGAFVDLPALDVYDHASAVHAVRTAWNALTVPREAEQATRLLAVVRDLRAVDQQLQRLQVERAAEVTRLLTRAIGRLEAAGCSVAGLVELAPQLICELGFDRGLISRVSPDGVWTAELMYIMGDPEWAETIKKAGQDEPQLLEPGLHETEVLTTRNAILVTGAQREPGRGHLAMVEASKTQSYVAAPILSDGKVIGLLHADRYGQRRDVDELDRQLLSGFAEAFRLVLSRAALAEELQHAQRSLRTVTASLEEALGSIHRVPQIRLQRFPDEGGEALGNGLVVRVGTRVTERRPLPDTLTRRELEVLALMAAGRSNAAIAGTLVITLGTAKQHVKHILRKLQAANRAEAVSRWFQAGA